MAYNTAKEFMQDYFKVFGPCEYKATVYNDKGSAEFKSKNWRDDPPGLKEIKASELVLPVFLRNNKLLAKVKDKKKIVKAITKYKELI